jgi:hypothetical protein
MKMLKHFRTSIGSSSSVRMKTRFGAKDSLITNELGFAHQADSGKSRIDSVPKGQNMANAKYLRKRIALVAAAALGVGMMAAAPAFASAGTAAVISAAAATSVSSGAQATSSTTISFTGASATDLGTLTAAVTTKPLGSTPSAVTFGTATGVTAGGATFTSGTGVLLQGGSANGSIAATVPVLFTPDVPGIYTITLTNTATTTPTQVWTVYSGSTVDTTHANTAFAVQGSNVVAGPNLSSGSVLNGSPSGLATARFTNFNTTTTNTHYYVTVSGGTLSAVTIQSAANGIVATNAGNTNGFNNTNGTNLTGGVDFWTGTTTTATTISSALDVQVTAASGTVTITVASVSPITGLLTTTSTTGVVFAAASGYSNSLSNAYIIAGAAKGISPDATVSVSKTIGTQAASIHFILLNTAGAAINGETVSASVTGPGNLGINAVDATYNAAATGRALSVTMTGVNAGNVSVWPDGTSGVATITISVTDATTSATTVLSTKSVTFYGAGATFAATQGLTIFPVGASGTDGSSTTPGATVLVTDSNGVAVQGASVYASSATPASATVTSSAQTTDAVGKAYFRVTGVAAGTSVLTFGNAATAPTVSTTTTVTVGSSTGTAVTLAFDKASYIPGEKATLTLTVKDASGNPVADGNYASLFTTDLTSSVAIGGATLVGSKSPTLAGGVATWAVYAPSTAGAFSVNGTTGTAGLVVAAQGKAVTASATVTGSTSGGLSAADSAAIAAAKAAADAATAAVATLSTTVASLIASITAQIRALSAQIAKLFAKSGGSTPGLPKTGAKKK